MLSAFVKSMIQFTITNVIDQEEEELEHMDATFDKIKAVDSSVQKVVFLRKAAIQIM
jgi:hypothetical protein